MKRVFQILITGLMLSFIFTACSTMRPPAGPAAPNRAAFVGTWTLSNIDYSGITEGSVQTVFDQAAPHDFIGSTWELTNSGNGSYTLTNGTSQNIFWSVNGGDALGPIFQFKKVNKGESARNVATGYQLIISNNSGASMTLKTLVYIGNKNGFVIYTFNKAK